MEPQAETLVESAVQLLPVDIDIVVVQLVAGDGTAVLAAAVAAVEAFFAAVCMALAVSMACDCSTGNCPGAVFAVVSVDFALLAGLDDALAVDAPVAALVIAALVIADEFDG